MAYFILSYQLFSVYTPALKIPIVLPREHTGHNKYPLPTTPTHGHHQMANAKKRFIIFFAAKDGESLDCQQKQDLELTVAQIMNFLLQNSDSN